VAYSKTVWVTGDVITATLANHWETQYDEAKADLDAALNATNGHTHSGAAGDGPPIPDESLASGVATASTANTIAKRDGSGSLTAKHLISDVADGTSPLQVTSRTLVPNLNADMLDGMHASDLQAPHIEAKRATGNSSYSGAPGSTTWTTAFPSPPVCVVSLETDYGTSGYKAFAVIESISTTGASFYAWNHDGSTTYQPNYRIIAMLET